MAREESDREDLLREATALAERIELAPAHADAEHVVIGFRASGAASLYFGGDAAYHFNSAGELRRAYQDGLLYKSERGKLVALRRIRQEHEVQLVRQPLSDLDQNRFLAALQKRLDDLADDLGRQTLTVVGQVPADADVLGRTVAWLARRAQVTVAKSPHGR